MTMIKNIVQQNDEGIENFQMSYHRIIHNPPLYLTFFYWGRHTLHMGGLRHPVCFFLVN